MYNIHGQPAPSSSIVGGKPVGNFPAYLASLPVEARQALGFYANIAQADEAGVDAATDTVYVKRPPTPEELEAQRVSDMAAKLTPGLVGLASAFRTTLRALFGPDAETNHDITEGVVVGTMLQLPAEQYDARTADLLKIAFEKLSDVSGDGTTWTFFETVGDLIPQEVQ